MTQPIVPIPRTDALMSLIQMIAGSENMTVAELGNLLAMKERWDAEESRKAYVVAMVQFKRNPPVLHKTDKVNHRGGQYNYVNLGKVAPVVAAALAEHGLSHAWSTEQREDGQISVTCHLTHEMGHREEVILRAMPDDTGSKNANQQVASTVTYLERYTLMAITGLAAQDMDDDGQAHRPVEARAEAQTPPAASGTPSAQPQQDRGDCDWHQTPMTKTSNSTGQTFHMMGASPDDGLCLGDTVVNPRGEIMFTREETELKPELDAEGAYVTTTETCTCKDFQYMGHERPCKHILAEREKQNQDLVGDLYGEPEGIDLFAPAPSFEAAKSSISEAGAVEQPLSATEDEAWEALGPSEATPGEREKYASHGVCTECPGNPPWLRKDDAWRTRYHPIPGGEHVHQEDRAAAAEGLPF